MSTARDASTPIARQILHAFLREQQQQMHCKILLVSLCGPHACGYANQRSPVGLAGLHVEPTDRLVGLNQPPRAHNWVGEYEHHLIDYSSIELGPGLQQLLRGDGGVLERILAPRQLLGGYDVQQLQRVTRKALSRRFHNHYREFFKRVLRDDDERFTVAHVLGVYRLGLTGVHLLRTGKIKFDLLELARDNGLAGLEELVQLNRKSPGELLEQKSPWINKLFRVHALLDDAYDDSELPRDPADPNAVEEYLMDMRRRFFDATTIAR